MKKLVKSAALLVGFVMVPINAQAQMFGAEQWVGGQNAILFELLSTQIGAAADVAAVLSNIRMVTSATNESLAIARTSYRMVKAVENYSMEDLMMDAKEGLYEAFPDLRAIEKDAYLFRDQWEERNKFFTTWNRYDARMNPVLRKLFEYSYEATIWPAVFPAAMQHQANATPVERMIWKRYFDTQQAMEVLVQKTSLAALAEKVKKLVGEAEKSENLEVQAQAHTAQMMTQEVSNTTEFLNLYKSEIAQQEAARAAERESRNRLSKGLSNGVKHLLMPGAMSITGGPNE